VKDKEVVFGMGVEEEEKGVEGKMEEVV